MMFVTETEAFEKIGAPYEQWKKPIMKKTEELVKGLRKTLTKQVVDEIYKSIQDDIETDMYSNFINFTHDLWSEALKYVIGEKTYSDKRDGSFADFAESLGWKPEDIRKKIYEDNKEELRRAITYDYLYDQLGHFFLYSPYWKGIDLNLDGQYTQQKIMKGFLERLASDSKFDSLLEELVDKRILSKKIQLHDLEKQIESLSDNLKALISEEE